MNVKIKSNERVKYWIDLADYDIATAKAMLQSSRYLYVGFMCHQTIEKALKGVIAGDCAEGEIPPKIHHLLKLADGAGLFYKMSDDQQSFLKALNPLNVEARYPEYKEKIAESLSNEMCNALITGTEEILCWIKNQL
jgi:HEPN domain-containing protein